MSSLFKGLGEFAGGGASQYAHEFRSGEVFIAQVLGLVKESTEADGKKVVDSEPNSIGIIRINRVNLPIVPEKDVTTVAEPLDRNHYRLPVIGEQVLVTQQNGKYYYFTVITSVANLLVNIDPGMMLNSAQSSGTRALLTDSDAERKRFESRLDMTTTLLESKTQLPSRVREGDTILEGRLGGVIKLTQTITKDGVWDKEKQITNIGDTYDGDPMLVMKSTVRSKSYEDLEIVNPPMQGLEDDDVNTENSSIYLTTTQNIPLQLGSSRKCLSWTANLVSAQSSILTDGETAVLSALIPERYDPSDQVNIIAQGELTFTGIGIGTPAGGSPAQVITADVRDYGTIVATVIDKLEGGYWHPAMYLNGRLQEDGYYGKSGETMMGIDRYAGGTLRDTPAGKQFWNLIDNAVPPAGIPWIQPGANYKSINLSTLSGAAQTWKWGYRGGPLEAQLRTLAGEMIYPTYVRNAKNYLTPQARALVEADGRILFNFVYACWNGPGWFQQFGKTINKAVESGITDTNQLTLIIVNRRINEGYEAGSAPNKLIAQGGRKIAKLVGVAV